LDRDGALITILGRELPGAGPVECATFALDADGRLYLGDIGGETEGRLVVAQLEPPIWPPPGR
jgi:hypothetical protein